MLRAIGLPLPIWGRIASAFAAMSSAPVPSTTNIRQILARVIADLRYGTRPSLVGRIPHLNYKMEETFRKGEYALRMIEIDGGSPIYLDRTFGGDTYVDSFWEEIGLPEKPSPKEIENAYSAYLQWKEQEVGFLVTEERAGLHNIKERIETKYRLAVKNADSAGDLLLIEALLSLLPDRALERGAIKVIDLKMNRDQSSRFAQFVENNRALGIIKNPIPCDRFLAIALLLHECGHALHHLLSPDKKAVVETLWKEAFAKEAVIGTTFIGETAEERIGYQRKINEFFAENFMHFIILSEEMVKVADTGPNAPQIREEREKLYRFFLAMYGNAQFDALAMLQAV